MEKTSAGFHFPLDIPVPGMAFHEACGKTPGNEVEGGLSEILRRKVRKPDRPKKFFPRQRVKEIDKFIFCCYLKRQENIFGKNGFPLFSSPGIIPGKSKPVGTSRLHFFHQRKRA